MIKQHPNSLISKFYGLHSIVWKNDKGKRQQSYLVVMNNVFKDFKVGIRFDLKGSSTGRTQLKKGESPYDEKRDFKTALKDNDFR